jgi:NADPH:quinone reductase-like Zn-dependent oxidoreductase
MISNGEKMKAARIHSFGGPEVIVVEDVPRPVPASGELLVRVAAAGVGPWDALIREGKSKVSPKPPLTLGSDLSGVVEAVGPGVAQFKEGDKIYGVTNPQFCGAQAEYAIASANMVAPRPQRLSHLEAASAPVASMTRPRRWRSDKIMAEVLSKPLAAKQVLTRSFFECKTF